LKPGSLFLVFFIPRQAVRAPFGGPAETGAGGVQRLLVPILLNGGFGYENYLHQREFLYQGISSRAFRRRFNLADYVQVKGAAFDNGLLQVELVREIPEAMMPRRISIEGSSASNVRQIDDKAVA
jgi:hypothetical protein